MAGRLGVTVAAVFAVAAAARAAYAATRLHNEKLEGRPDTSDSAPADIVPDGPPAPADPWPQAPTVPHQPPAPRAGPSAAAGARPTIKPVESPPRKRGRRTKEEPAAKPVPEPVVTEPVVRDPVVPDPVLAPPGFHIYRPSSATGETPGPERDDR
jgi:hypothetical protein